MKKKIIYILIIFLFEECSTVPITGRKRVNFVSDAQVLPASFAQYTKFLKENKVSSNRVMSNRIKNVGENILDKFSLSIVFVSDSIVTSYKNDNT